MRADALAGRRLSLLLLGAFAVVAFVLAVGGVYGLMAFAVGQRQHEFAVRQALGSTRRGIARLVLRNGFVIGGAGIALGLVLALASAQAARGVLYRRAGQRSTDARRRRRAPARDAAACLPAACAAARRLPLPREALN